MKISTRADFYSHIRAHLFSGHLTELQVQGIETILNEWELRSDLTDIRWLAYMLGTVYHETAKTMQPIEEYGHGKGRPYSTPDSKTGKVYYGRGYVQLTWNFNYKRMGSLLDIDLIDHPEYALQPIVATQIMFEGMTRGTFTGKKLSDYFNQEEEDWVNARRIINGIDRAELIAGYAKQFYQALLSGNSNL